MIGTVLLKQYQVVSFLGQGAMGKVFLARHRTTADVVVIKVLNKDRAKDASARQFFDREIQSLAELNHPCIVGFRGADFDDPAGPCIAMEFIPGVTLESLLERHHRLSVDQVHRLLLPLCRALNYGHARHVIHRDLKPANLMVIDPDTVRESLKVMDFGLAQLDAKPHISLDKLRGHDRGTACGTPMYVAPEGLRGDPVDHRADIYSVGIVLFELLTGAPPFNYSDTNTVLNAHLNDRPPRFSQRRGHVEVPPEIELVVQRCLEKYPSERPQSARELAEAFCRAFAMPCDPILFQDEGPPPGPKREPSPVPESVLRDPHALQNRFDAFMPEPIAVAKLRGFVHDAGGQIVESEPGKIRVQFGERPAAINAAASLLGSWFGGTKLFGKAPPDAIEMLLYMARKTAPGASLELTVVLKPLDGVHLAHPTDWQPRCTRLFTAMRAYLMAN